MTGKRTIVVGVASVAILVLVLAASWRRGRSAGANAIVEDAIRRGMNPADVRYPAHWPMEVFADRIEQAHSPAEVEAFVDADSISYKVVPIAGTRSDSALVHFLWFSLGRQTRLVQASYAAARAPTAAGSDWRPTAGRAVSRSDALQWWDEAIKASKPKGS